MLGLGAGSIYGSTLMDEKFAIDMDGTSDRVDFGSQFQTTFAGSFTINLWMKDIIVPATTGTTTLQMISGTYDGIGEEMWEIMMYNGGAHSGKVRWLFKSNNDLSLRQTSSAFTTSSFTSWNMLTVTAYTEGVGGDNTELKIFHNGLELVGTTSLHTSALNHSYWNSAFDGISILGRGAEEGAKAALRGTYTDWALWNTALTSSQLVALYNSGVIHDARINIGNYTSSNNLQAYFNFNDKTATELISGQSGSLINSPEFLEQ